MSAPSSSVYVVVTMYRDSQGREYARTRSFTDMDEARKAKALALSGSGLPVGARDLDVQTSTIKVGASS